MKRHTIILLFLLLFLPCAASAQRITAGGEYRICGKTDSIVVDAPNETVTLILDNAIISAIDQPAVSVTNAAEVVLFCPENTVNTLQSSIDTAVICCVCPLTVAGTGTLNIETDAGHGICSESTLSVSCAALNVYSPRHALYAKQDIYITYGELNITCGKDALHADEGSIQFKNTVLIAEAADDALSAGNNIFLESGAMTLHAGGQTDGRCKGMKAKNSVYISGGTLDITSTDDAIHANNGVMISGGAMTLRAGDDAIHADRDVWLGGGTIDILESCEGIEGRYLHISGGTITVCAEDDGLNASGTDENDTDAMIEITGGTLTVNAETDGIDSNGTVQISGGTIVVFGPVNGIYGNGTLDSSAAPVITGGTYVGLGIRPSKAFDANASQGVISCTVKQQKAGSEVILMDENNVPLLRVTAEKIYNAVTISTPALTTGVKYTLQTGKIKNTVSVKQRRKQ